MLRRTNGLSTMLNRRVEIWRQARSDERDKLGQRPKVDELYATVWAGVIPQTGSLLSGRTAETTLSRTTHKILLRYRDDIVPSMWVKVDGVRYDILYILDPNLDHERLELFCEVVIDE